jgi:hypothetical protein
VCDGAPASAELDRMSTGELVFDLDVVAERVIQRRQRGSSKLFNGALVVSLAALELIGGEFVVRSHILEGMWLVRCVVLNERLKPGDLRPIEPIRN